VTCRPIFRQHPKNAHATLEKVQQEVFYMWSVPFPLLGNGLLNTFPQKQTRGTVGDLVLSNGAVNRLCRQYRLYFPWGPCKVVIRQSSSKDGSSEVVAEGKRERELRQKNENGASPRH
jgi:hypothetical protein